MPTAIHNRTRRRARSRPATARGVDAMSAPEHCRRGRVYVPSTNRGDPLQTTTAHWVRNLSAWERLRTQAGEAVDGWAVGAIGRLAATDGDERRRRTVSDQMVIRLEGTDLPGSSCGPSNDRLGGYPNIRVAVQGRQQQDLPDPVPGDARTADWALEAIVVSPPPDVDLRGPHTRDRRASGSSTSR